jgi:hypothetical protein
VPGLTPSGTGIATTPYDGDATLKVGCTNWWRNRTDGYSTIITGLPSINTLDLELL